jgi:two-component system, sensor histidine kinase and response regulator
MTELDHVPAEAARHALPSELVHDLRSPLNQIIGYSDLMIEKAHDGGNEGYVLDLQKVRAAGHRMQAIIEDNFYPILSLHNSSQGIDAIGVEGEAGANHKPEPISHDDAHAGARRVPGSGPSYILIVDDVEANRDVLSRRLERQGYSVATAENGRQALDMLAANPFDLVLLDIMMPEMDGYEVLHHIKSDDHLRFIPVIMISALSEMDSVARCIEMGAEDYLPKPFNPVLLKARIGACLERKLAHDRELRLLDQVQDNYKCLQELETLRDDLTHMIIHDLRTPLTSVLAGIQTLDVVGDLNVAQREVLGIAVNGGVTLVGIINDLLDVEKLESGSMQLENSEVSVKRLVDSAVNLVVALADEKSLMLLWDTAAELPALHADERKLHRVLVNLLGNAIKFTPAGGTVTVKARLGDDQQSVVFSVTDTGEGIPAESFDRIFEKFGQVETREGGRTNSTGLGLTFCKHTVEAHGGSIRVESEPGRGSTFSFAIPTIL